MTQEPPSPESMDEIVRTFKALADPIRLRLLGLVAERQRSGQELAAALDLSPGTISHHLKLLRETDLVLETRHPPFSYYTLNQTALSSVLRSVLKRDRVQQFAREGEIPGDEKRVLNAFFDGPRLKSIPAQRRKKEIVFEELLRRLPRRKEYPEKDLSRWIEAIHEDFCTIRREFVMGAYMDREGGIYRLTEKGRAVVARRTASATPSE